MDKADQDFDAAPIPRLTPLPKIFITFNCPSVNRYELLINAYCIRSFVEIGDSDRDTADESKIDFFP